MGTIHSLCTHAHSQLAIYLITHHPRTSHHSCINPNLLALHSPLTCSHYTQSLSYTPSHRPRKPPAHSHSTHAPPTHSHYTHAPHQHPLTPSTQPHLLSLHTITLLPLLTPPQPHTHSHSTHAPSPNSRYTLSLLPHTHTF